MNQEPEILPPEPEQPPVELELQQLTEQLELAHKRVNELAHAVQAGERDREEFKQRLTRERERMLDVERGMSRSRCSRPSTSSISACRPLTTQRSRRA